MHPPPSQAHQYLASSSITAWCMARSTPARSSSTQSASRYLASDPAMTPIIDCTCTRGGAHTSGVCRKYQVSSSRLLALQARARAEREAGVRRARGGRPGLGARGAGATHKVARMPGSRGPRCPGLSPSLQAICRSLCVSTARRWRCSPGAALVASTAASDTSLRGLVDSTSSIRSRIAWPLGGYLCASV
jgi:hypothetical protein